MSSRYAIPMIRFARSARHGRFGRISWCATDALQMSPGGLLSVNPLHLLSQSAPSSFYFFECPFHERVFRFHRALLGRGRLCPANEFGQRLGCARHPSKGHCLVVVGPEDELAAIGYSDVIVVRHEIAHCNGWRGNHPGIRSLKGQETQEQYGARFERWKKFVDERDTRAAELKALAPTVVEKPAPKKTAHHMQQQAPAIIKYCMTLLWFSLPCLSQS